MKKIILEVCVDSVESAVNAEKGGADRVELCSNLIIGGTAPSLALFEEVKRRISIPVRVMIRERFGDFLYTEPEKNVMLESVRKFRDAGASGIVFGCLMKNGEIDIEFSKKILGEAGNMSTTFHRAFDMCSNPLKALKQLEKLGVDTVLTSGQRNSCLEGKELIKKLVGMSKESSRIEIMAGAGLNADNAEEIYDCTKAAAFHFSAKKVVQSQMIYKNKNINMGLQEFSEYEKIEADESKVREMRILLDNLQKQESSE